MFGNAPATGGLFSGAPQKPAQGNLFGQAAPGGGAADGKPSNLFGGAPASTQGKNGGLFGAKQQSAGDNKPSGGLFGQQNGATQAAPTSFGQGAPSQTSTSSSKPSPFGQPAPASGAPAQSSLFSGIGAVGGGGENKPAAGGLFNNTQTTPIAATPPLAATGAPSAPATTNLFNTPKENAASSSFLKPPAAKPSDQKSDTAPSLGFAQPQKPQEAAAPAKPGTLFGDKTSTPAPAPDAGKQPESAKSGGLFAQKPAMPASTGQAAPGSQPGAAGQQQAAQVDPAKKLQTEQAAQDEAFKNKPLSYVTKKWQDQIRQNETQFNTAVENLRDYEILLIKSLGEIEKIETQSVQVKGTYKENMTELQDVSAQQNALLGELTAIETELDQMLPQFLGNSSQRSGKDNKFVKSVLRNPDMYETASNREKVFDEALNLETNIKKLDQEVQLVNQQMQQSERKHAKAADLYLFGDDEAKRQQVTDMERTLENFYSSLKWIENASVDLKFQVDDVQEKLNRQAFNNNNNAAGSNMPPTMGL